MTDSSIPDPMVKLEPGGVAPIISYNVPEPTVYSGRNFIDLQFPASYFVVGTNPAGFTAAVAPKLLNSDLEGAAARGLPTDYDALAAAGLAVDPAEAALMAREGKRLQVYRSLSGALATTWVEAVLAPEPGQEPGARATLIPLPGDPVEIRISISSPGDGATVSGPHTGVSLTVQGTVWSNFPLTDVSVWALNEGTGTRTGGTATRSGGNWSIPLSLTAPGKTMITAVATSSNSGITKDHTIWVTVALAAPPDTTSPAVSITSPANGASLSGPSSPVTTTVSGTAADLSGIQTVDVKVDSGDYFPANPRATGDWSTWTMPVSLSAGNHTITARATDKAGNPPSQQSVSVSVAITLPPPPPDTTGPAVSITSPTTGQAIQGPYSGATITVTGTASDPGGVRSVELQLGHNPVFVAAAPTTQGDWSQWRGVLLVTDPGPHIIAARVTDNAGNVTTTDGILVNVTLVPEVVNRLNRLIIVESYRLSSHLGRYGAGRTLKTFSLLPGEKTRISLKTYTKSETDAKDASSILDSFTNESAIDFETSMADEQSNKKNYDESFQYKVGTEAKASWGWGSASVSGSMSGGTNSARESIAKNISAAVQKHVSKASAKREIQVNANYEVKTQTGEETSLERDIANINVGATLNFVFRQMNQEFITLLHLVDIRIGYFKVDTVNGVEEYTYREATLPEFDALLRDVIVPDKRTEVRNAVLHQLTNIFDYKDYHHVLVEEEPLRDRNGNIIPLTNYLRMRKDYTSTYVNEASGTQIKVPGVILAATSSVLRTEGVIVEALLGHGDGLDTYSHGLQEQAVRARALENSRAELDQAVTQLALEIVQTKDLEMANLYKQIFGAGPSSSGVSAEGLTAARQAEEPMTDGERLKSTKAGT
jgi:Bacterial Ig domain